MEQASKAYTFLPKRQKNLTEITIINEMNQKINELNMDEEIKSYQLELAQKITDKLLTGKWNIDDYISFIQAIRHNIVETYPKQSMPAIIRLFEFDEDNLKEDLNKIKEYTKDFENPLYPYRELVTTKDKRQVPTVLEYSKMDAFKMITVLLSRIHGIASATAIKLYEQEENREACQELLNNAISGKEDIEPFLINYYKTFGFLSNLEGYCDFYFDYREIYVKTLREAFARKYNLEKRKMERRNDDYHIGKVVDMARGKGPKMKHYDRFLHRNNTD